MERSYTFKRLMRQPGTCHYSCSTLHTVDLFNSTWTLACCESFGQQPTSMTMETYYEHTHVHDIRNIYIYVYKYITLMFNRKRRNTSTTSLFSIVIVFSPPESNCSYTAHERKFLRKKIRSRNPPIFNFQVPFERSKVCQDQHSKRLIFMRVLEGCEYSEFLVGSWNSVAFGKSHEGFRSFLKKNMTSVWVRMVIMVMGDAGANGDKFLYDRKVWWVMMAIFVGNVSDG